MAQAYQCPRCETQLGIPDVLVGKEVRCGACATVFVAGTDGTSQRTELPAPAPAANEPSAPTEPLAPAPVRRPDDEPVPFRRRRRHFAPHRAGMILAFGIVGFFFMPIVFGPLAWIMGRNDLNEMREGRMDPEGEGMTRAGTICGMINCIFISVAVVLVILVVGLMIATKGFK